MRPGPPALEILHNSMIRKGFSMMKLRAFLHTYSPLFALTAAIVGLYTMAICIGFGINVHI
jgi:hypothetical protein